MSDETPGAGQSALPPREGSVPKPALRLAQMAAGQYVLTTQDHTIPTQISSVGLQQGIQRIISISPSRVGQTTTPLRPSLTNQSIVKAIQRTTPKTGSNVRLQLFQNTTTSDASSQQIIRPSLKRSLPPVPEKKDTYSVKLERVLNHHNVRSKIVKEKYNEHLLENYHIEMGKNLLDLYQFAKRPKTQHLIAYLNENCIDPREVEDVTTPATPSATAITSLPGISSTSNTMSSSSSTSTPMIISSAPLSPAADTKAASVTKATKTPVGYPSSTNNQEQIVEKAKQEAYVVQRINDLQKEGLWTEKRLPKVQEAPRAKAHWDFLLEEMVWLAADFAQERKWKKAAAKKCARMVQKHFQDKALAAQRAEKAHEQHIRRVAAFCAKEIKNFWSNVEKLVEFKQNTRLEEKRKKALDQHLSFIVDQTEKYSQLLAEGMNKPTVETQSNNDASSRGNSDDEFRPDSENSTDDEETIALEEAHDQDEKSEEVAALQRESEMAFEDFLSELPKDYLQNRENIRLNDTDSDSVASEEASTSTSATTKSKKPKDDDEFKVESSEEDDEDTIQEQEKAEGEQDHKAEINDLNEEAEMDIDELREKYANLPPPPSTEDEEDSNMSSLARSLTESDDSESSELETSSEDECDDDVNLNEEKDVGLQSLLDDAKVGDAGDKKTDNNDLINDAAAIAESIQPKGNTLSSTSVVTPIPFLLKFALREYQHIGLDWLVTMFERKLNGILADEMGLGKTIQTIALLAHLACEKSNWGPHLIVVPTSVMLNWEMECKKWCPGFKILTYYGTQRERKLKRIGWTKPNAFHVCITSYKLVIQDHQSFRRKKWKYLILDEAQNIKNFKSQRWQLLLNFQTQQRLLLTGTPLQNNLMELWSLMHFLMPHVFQSHREFKEWFSNPVTGMIEGNSEYNENIIKRLHKVLRPFLLRRLKCEVEKQMPKKYEHVVMCRLSKRQRFLYDDYMSRVKTKETLAGGNLLSVINVLMQLRKVCNHPNLFEPRPTLSPFHCEGIVQHIPALVYTALSYNVWKHVDLTSLNLNFLHLESHLDAYKCYRMRQSKVTRKLIEEISSVEFDLSPPCPPSRLSLKVHKNFVNKAVRAEVKEEKGYGLQQAQKVKLIQHPNIKTLQIASSSSSPTTTGQPVNLTSVLKPPVSGFAQLVQTSTGKHILLTPTCNINTQQLGITGTTTVMTSSGQRLTVLSKQPVPTATNSQTPAIAKAVVKVQLTSLPNSAVVAQNSNESSSVDDVVVPQIPPSRKAVNTRFIEKLYLQSSKNKNLDVRWTDSLNKNREVGENAIKTEADSDEEDWRNYKLDLLSRLNDSRCSAVPIYGTDLVECVTKFFNASRGGGGLVTCADVQHGRRTDSTTDCMRNIIYTPQRRIEELTDIFERFLIYVPSVQAPQPELQIWNPDPSTYWGVIHDQKLFAQNLREPTTPLHQIASAMMTQFPHPRLIQYDCGKLQTLDRLLRKLKNGSHRVLIFTQMTKMLDVLEAFLNFHGHIYLRLDGSTKIDQRQILMERFNGDSRIFAFILSTRSGGVGVNLTGADTVIFYDSDWNPTMDAQAQDRCHRIGQTRDVHIYRLVSEMTIEENILKKANQKRLLGDLAIEGGNFTTAYFKSSTIQDLFNIDSTEISAATRMSEVVELSREREKLHEEATNSDEKAAMGVLENALAECEDDQDVIAARTAKAEAVADLAEFDETIPLEEQQEKEKEPEISKAEMEVQNLVKQLTPIERYAMKFIEATEAAWSIEHLAAAEREIEEKKRVWEENRIASMREEEERRARELEEENEILTFSREDATNQIWVSHNTNEQMPMWCPPTPPQQDGDVYVDQTMSFLYDAEDVMNESQLPPVYVKKEPKRTRHDAGLSADPRRVVKVHRKDDTTYPPKSLFERPPMANPKMRRDIREIIKASRRSKPTGPISARFPSGKPQVEPPLLHAWTIHEDMAILKVIQTYQGLNLNLFTCTAHTPNWDFVSDYVNTVSITYRSPKQCRSRFENFLVPREEGKQDSSPRKKKQKSGGVLYSTKYPMQSKSNRPMRTAQMYMQDNNNAFSQIMIQRYETLKALSSKKTVLSKPTAAVLGTKNTKHDTSESGDEHPPSAVEIAAKRAERLAKEKKSLTPEQIAAQRLHLLQRGFTAQSPSVSSGGNATSSVATAQVSSGTVTPITTINTTVIATTPPNTLRMSRIVASPLQSQNIVSVTGISPAQLQAATQRLIVSGTPGQSKATVVSAGTVAGKAISPAQLQMIRQATLKQQQQLRLQSAGLSGQVPKSATVTIAGQTAVQVQFSQGQPRTQYVKQGTVTVGGKQITRTLNDAEMAALLKRQQLQQKVLQQAANQSSSSSLQNQVFAQTIQAAGPSNSPVATIVKAVSSSGVTQTVIGTPVKALPQGLKGQNPQQLRTLQIQQQLMAQKKLVNPGKIAGIAHVAGKGGVATQLILGSKPPAMTLQQFQQVMRSPMPQNPVVLGKPGGPRVIPVQTGQGNKPTIQVVTASTQGLTTTLRPTTSNLSPGTALIGNIKVHNVGGSSAQQQAILSQVSAALQGQNVRQSSPVRIQTAMVTTTPTVTAVSVQQSSSTVANAPPGIQHVQQMQLQNDKNDHA